MKRINPACISKQSSIDDIREYFNRVYNQMKEDPEGRFPANFEASWRLFFDKKEKALAYLKATCKPDKDYLILLDRETGTEKDFLVTYLVLGMFVKNLRSDLIPVFNDVFLQENEVRPITVRNQEYLSVLRPILMGYILSKRFHVPFNKEYACNRLSLKSWPTRHVNGKIPKDGRLPKGKDFDAICQDFQIYVIKNFISTTNKKQNEKN